METLPKKVHAVGAGGIGVSALLKLLFHRGVAVSGSDKMVTEAVTELQAMGISVATSFDAGNVPADCDLLLYSDAFGEDNVERAEAARRGIRQASYFKMLGEVSRSENLVTVSGTNGKSSTTAMLGSILIEAGLDPTVIVGTKVATFPDKNLRQGATDLFVAEACEHMAHMLHLSPRAILLTDIRADHLDFYRDLGHIMETFQEYVSKLPEDGLLVRDAADAGSMALKVPCRSVTYALEGDADYSAHRTGVGGGKQTFEIKKGGQSLGEFSLRVPGAFNVKNALAAAAMAMELGATPDAVRSALSAYPGIWRRFETVAEKNGVTVISDYGHHPDAVAATLAAADEFYPNRRIVLAFQPHHRNRTRNLFDGFVASFDDADVLVLAEIYDPAGREGDADVSSADLAKAVDARGKRAEPAVFAPTLDDVSRELKSRIAPGDVVILMGAGDIPKVAPTLF